MQSGYQKRKTTNARKRLHHSSGEICKMQNLQNSKLPNKFAGLALWASTLTARRACCADSRAPLPNPAWSGLSVPRPCSRNRVCVSYDRQVINCEQGGSTPAAQGWGMGRFVETATSRQSVCKIFYGSGICFRGHACTALSLPGFWRVSDFRGLLSRRLGSFGDFLDGTDCLG